MLRASSQSHAQAVNVSSVMDGQDVGEIEGGPELVSMAQAVVSADPDDIKRARDNLVQRLSEAAMIDAAGVASNFQRMVRIADSTGITLGDFESVTADLREDLGINRFAERPSG